MKEQGEKKTDKKILENQSKQCEENKKSEENKNLDDEFTDEEIERLGIVFGF